MRIREFVQRYNGYGFEFKVSLSIGVATGYQGCVLNKVLEEADMTMYEEKSSKASAKPDGARTHV